jgi:2'-5' RNA ligase
VSDPWRLFIGLPLPEAQAARCEEWLAPHRAAHPEARWLPTDVLHVTLVFLGAVAPDRVAPLRAAITAVADGAGPIDVELGQGGGRARRGDDGVAWLEVGRGAAEITRLASSLEAAVGWRSGPHSAGQLPHVTVARRASGRLIADLAGAGGAGPGIGWRVDSVVLLRSHLGGIGARYEPVHVARLGGSDGWSSLARDPG